MLYIKINTDLYPIEKFQSFQTQKGNDAVRVFGNAPQAPDGFMIVDEHNRLISDKHAYKHLYRQDDNCKEYTAVEEEIVPTEEFTLGTPESPYNVLANRIAAINSNVVAITPYTESKLVGIQDSECIFTSVPKSGIPTATLVTEKGEYLPCEIEMREGNIRVTFEELKEVATVTVSIQ